MAVQANPATWSQALAQHKNAYARVEKNRNVNQVGEVKHRRILENMLTIRSVLTITCRRSSRCERNHSYS
jgi:hypothetical protein